jgi:hypothetical protein
LYFPIDLLMPDRRRAGDAESWVSAPRDGRTWRAPGSRIFRDLVSGSAPSRSKRDGTAFQALTEPVR